MCWEGWGVVGKQASLFCFLKQLFWKIQLFQPLTRQIYKLADNIWKLFFLFFQENRARHFMWIVSYLWRQFTLNFKPCILGKLFQSSALVVTRAQWFNLCHIHSHRYVVSNILTFIIFFQENICTSILLELPHHNGYDIIQSKKSCVCGKLGNCSFKYSTNLELGKP